MATMPSVASRSSIIGFLAAERLLVARQPIRRVSDGSVVGYELLARGQYGPAEAIVNALDKEGLLLEHTKATVLRAQELAARDRVAYHVNVRPQDLPALAEWLSREEGYLEMTAVEIHERGRLDADIWRAAHIVQDLGMGVWVDDATDRRLSDIVDDLPVTGLKISHTTVHEALKTPQNGAYARLKNLSDWCKDRKLSLIPEGVTPSTAAKLNRDLGVVVYQSYENGELIEL